MRTIEILLLASLATAPLLLRREGGGQQQQGDEPKKPADNRVTRFFQGQTERLTKEVVGSWMLIEYFDPEKAPLEGAASGFVTFQDGFMTLILAIDTVEPSLFGAHERLLLRSGAYRYRFDEQGALQMSSVMSFTTQTDDGDPEREPSGQVFEWLATLDDQVFEIRNPVGVRLSFRKVTAGDFPESAIRKLDGRRGGVDHWEEEGDDDTEMPR